MTSGLRSVFLVLTLLTILLPNALAQGAMQTGKSWFDEMLQTASSAKGEGWKNELNRTWGRLRLTYNNHEALSEMSWEERDKIWQAPLQGKNYSELAERYRKAYLVSCNERGVKPASFNTQVKDVAGLKKVRNEYLDSRKSEYIVLTPKAGKAPRINGASVYGVRPGNELIYRLAVTGERPMKLLVKGLPKGCSFDEKRGVINGRVAVAGDYTLTITAENKHGKAKKELQLKVGDQIALTPPMGWNSWNSFACDVTEKDIRNTVDQFILTGLADYGWSYVNIDDCWMKKPDVPNMTGKDKAVREAFYNEKAPKRARNNKLRFNESEVEGTTRDSRGNVLANKDFPDMKALTDYIHSFGLKAGIYSSPGPLTCQCYEGSYEHELADVRQYTQWGFDYLKYDWCGYRGIISKPTTAEIKAPYEQMGKALQETNRDIIYSLCQYGWNEVWKWGREVGGNSWRTTGDIRDNWENVSNIVEKQVGLEAYAGPGHWNDPDMLVVGYVGWSRNLRPSNLSPNEQYTHITLWSLLSAPLLIGCDLKRMDDFTFGLLSNAEVIEVNQDVLGRQASRIVNASNIQVWVKELADGSKAVGVFNYGEEPVEYQLDLSGLKLASGCKARDLWRQQDAGEFKEQMLVSVNRHGVKFYKLSALNTGQAETGK